MFKRLLLVLFSCLVVQQESLADESYGYLRNGLAFSKIPCTTDPSVNATGFLSTQPNSTINCSMVIPPEVELRMKRQALKCERFPEVKNDPLPCAKRNYKVFAMNLTERSRSQLATHAWLASYASNISKECLNNVSDMICKVVAPACDRNETTVVELVSRQDCERIISCLNTTSKVKVLRDGMMDMCRSLPDASTATKIPLSLVYTEFEDNTTPKTHSNDTKTSTTPTTQSPILNKTHQTQSRNGTDNSDGPNTPTRRPVLNSTDQNREEATMWKSSPTTQANMTKPNPKSTTEKPTVNATYQEKKEAKSVANLTPTTESLLNPNYTTHGQYDTELSKTPKMNTTPSLVVTRGNTTRSVAKCPSNKAAQFNTRMNALAFLLVSFLSMCTWQ